jgi:hypothetical protein
MPWYRVKVHGDLDTAAKVLRGSEIVFRVEGAFAHFVDAGPPRLTVLHAIVEADDAEGAEARIRQALADRGEFELETTELQPARGS